MCYQNKSNEHSCSIVIIKIGPIQIQARGRQLCDVRSFCPVSIPGVGLVVDHLIVEARESDLAVS